MKATKSVVIAALVVGGLLAWNPALCAAETNTPPSAPSAGAPPGGQRPPGLRGPDVDQLAKQLDLTDDQKVKVKTILDAQGKKMRELNADTSLSREEKRPKMQSIREETMTQMKAVLSPEQFEKWQAQRNRRPGGPGGPGGPPPGAPHASGTNAPAAPAKK